MEEEIFGPILPIVRCNTVADAIHFINTRYRKLHEIKIFVFSTQPIRSVRRSWKSALIGWEIYARRNVQVYTASGVPLMNVN